MTKYRARADITVNGNLVSAGNTFVASPQEAEGFIVNGQAEPVKESAKEPATRESKRTKKGR